MDRDRRGRGRRGHRTALGSQPLPGAHPVPGRAPDSTEILASRAPTLAQAIRIASTKAFVILDGTPLPIDRIATDRPFYSGKHKEHGMNVQVITDPAGRLLWASPALPGAVHDIKAARTHVIIDALAKARVQCWADKGYRGSGGTIRLPYWGRWRTLSTGQQAVNRSHAEIRALVEQAMATLKTWRLLRKLRCSTTRITDLVKAVLALELAVSTRGRKEPHRSALLS